MVQAEVGRVELDARLREAPPEQSPHVDGDITPGLLAVTAVVSALFHRERTGEGQHLDVSMAEALVYTDEWTSTDLAGYEGPRIPDTWNYPIFRVADGTDVAFMGDPTGRLVEIAAAISDDVVEPDEVRAKRRGASSPSSWQRVPDFPTLEARFDLFGFLVSEVRTVQQLADTPWADERGVFVEVEPGARVAGAPFHSDRTTVGVRGPAPRFAQHTRAVLAERLRAVRRRARSARDRRGHPHLGRRRHRPSRLEVADHAQSSCDEFRGARSSN